MSQVKRSFYENSYQSFSGSSDIQSSVFTLSYHTYPPHSPQTQGLMLLSSQYHSGFRLRFSERSSYWDEYWDSVDYMRRRREVYWTKIDLICHVGSQVELTDYILTGSRPGVDRNWAKMVSPSLVCWSYGPVPWPVLSSTRWWVECQDLVSRGQS